MAGTRMFYDKKALDKIRFCVNCAMSVPQEQGNKVECRLDCKSKKPFEDTCDHHVYENEMILLVKSRKWAGTV